jgi:hypothetical protein
MKRFLLLIMLFGCTTDVSIMKRQDTDLEPAAEPNVPVDTEDTDTAAGNDTSVSHMTDLTIGFG